jgi:hypothetical protein
MSKPARPLDDAAHVFSEIFRENKWKSKVSASGTGSSLQATKILRERLPAILGELGIRTIVDAPCGDFNWMKALNYEFAEYYGIDIVPNLIEKLAKEDFRDHYNFTVGNVVSDLLPHADAIFCRDCLVHLPFEMGLKAISNWKRSNFGYALVTTFPGRPNRDGRLGGWRVLDMQGEPFNWPQPLHLIREREPNPDDRNNEKSIGVWRFDDLP